MERKPDRFVEGQACICTEPGLPAMRSELWHDAKCDRWRALGGKDFDIKRKLGLDDITRCQKSPVTHG